MQYVVDVTIVGGGILGLSLACSLEGSGLRVLVLEQCVPETFLVSASQALSVSAINIDSEKFLMRLGIWSDITSSSINCYHGIKVWDKDSFGHISFDDKALGYSHLGYIIENMVIRTAMWKKAQQYVDITLIAPTRLKQVEWYENEVHLTLQGSDTIITSLVIGADGTDSWIRSKAEIPLAFWDYRYHALVANVRTEEPHDNIAQQIFHGNGVLAFLPLKDSHLCSIVWLLEPDSANQMYEVNSEAFNKALCMAFDARLGLCSLESERQIFQLTSRYARQFASHRLALVGNAAHTVYPLLAGHGLNLGFMDVVELSEELRSLYQEGKDIGQYFHLRRYERRRKYSSAIMFAGTLGFYELFNGDHPIKKLLRDMSLRFVDNLPSIKLMLLRQAIGQNDLSNWLC